MCAHLRAPPPRRARRLAPARALGSRRSPTSLPTPPRVHADLLRQDLALRRAHAAPRARLRRHRHRWSRRSASAPPPPPSRSPTTCCSGRCPFADADRLVKLWQNQAFRGYARMELSPRELPRLEADEHGPSRRWARYRRSATTWSARASRSGSTARRLSAELFPVLGVRPALGRVFTDPDDAATGAPARRAAERRALAGALRRRSRRAGPARSCSTTRRTWSSA